MRPKCSLPPKRLLTPRSDARPPRCWVCYSALRRVPRRDLHPLDKDSMKSTPRLRRLRHDARCVTVWAGRHREREYSSKRRSIYRCLRRAPRGSPQAGALEQAANERIAHADSGSLLNRRAPHRGDARRRARGEPRQSSWEVPRRCRAIPQTGAWPATFRTSRTFRTFRTPRTSSRHLRGARPREFDRDEYHVRRGLGDVVRHPFGDHDEVAFGHALRDAPFDRPAHHLAVLLRFDDRAARGDGPVPSITAQTSASVRCAFAFCGVLRRSTAIR